MNNDQQPPGGGRGPPQLPPNLPNVGIPPELLQNILRNLPLLPQQQQQQPQPQPVLPQAAVAQLVQQLIEQNREQIRQEHERQEHQRLELQRQEQLRLQELGQQNVLRQLALLGNPAPNPMHQIHQQIHVHQAHQIQQLIAQALNAAHMPALVPPAQIPQASPNLPAQFPVGQAYQQPPTAAPIQIAQNSPAINVQAVRSVEQMIAHEEANVQRGLAQQAPAAVVNRVPPNPGLERYNEHMEQQRQQQLHQEQVQIQQIQRQQQLQQQIPNIRPQPQMHQVQAPHIHAPLPNTINQVPAPPVHLPQPMQANVPIVVPDAQVGRRTPPPRQQQVQPQPRRQRQRRQRQEPDAPPRVDEALAYLRIIKNTFAEDVPVYHRFLEIMKDFRAQRIETPDVIEQVAALLYESPELVLGFNTFLPTGFKITMLECGRYVFDAPQSGPKILLTPAERRAQEDRLAADAPPAAQEPEAGLPDFRGDEGPADDDPMDEGNNRDPDDSGTDAERQDEEQEEDGDPLVEELVIDDDENEVEPDTDSDKEQVNKDLTDQTLKIVELLKSSFCARPGKVFDFLTFMDFFITTREYYRKQNQLLEKSGAAPPQIDSDSRNEPMEVDGEDNGGKNSEEKKEEDTQNQEKMNDILEEKASNHMISMLASCCLGEPELLSTTIDILPYLGQILDEESPITEKVLAILRFEPTNEQPNNRQAIEQADRELVKQMEKFKMGGKKNEKLKISASGNGEENLLIIFNKSYRTLYDNLKSRVTPHQLRNLFISLNMYINMEVTREQFVRQLPKIMEVSGSEAENIILKLIGHRRNPLDQPENDVDAVMRKDLPAVQPKRGLRDQKMLQQVQNVEAATVCTLGPSYRLLKDAKTVECSGQIELGHELKDVLNDKWISYPSWSSEDVGTQVIKKSNLEEFHFKTEDERYELDIIVDSNKTIIEELTKTLRDYEALSDEKKKSFKLNDQLNCQSRATFLRVMTKIFTNSVQEIIATAQKNVHNGLKKIIESLSERDSSWVHFQQDTNKAWRDALEKQLTSAMSQLNNHQKNTDQKAFKSKPLVAAIEASYEEKKLKNDSGPHLTLVYTPEQRVYRDVNSITEHFFNDLPGGKADRDRTKIVIFKVLMEWLSEPGQDVQISLDSGEQLKFQGDLSDNENILNLLNVEGRRLRCETGTASSSTEPAEESTPEAKTNTAEKFTKNLYKRDRRVIYGDDSIYMLVRYHHMIVERFTKLLATEANYMQEDLDNQQKRQQWKEGIGADMHSRNVLDKNVAQKRDAVNEIRNIRSSPAGYYEQTLRELRLLGKAQIDMSSFDDTLKHIFPADAVLFNCIDKLLRSFARNVHLATCADDTENPIKLYLEFRKRLFSAESEEETASMEQEYAIRAEQTLRGKNTYRFEFIKENVPTVNIWVIPREEKDSPEEEEDDDGNGKDDEEQGKDDDNEKEEEEGEGGDEPDDDVPEPSNDDDVGDDGGDDDEDDEESDSGSVGEGTDVPEEADVSVELEDVYLAAIDDHLKWNINKFFHMKSTTDENYYKKLLRKKGCKIWSSRDKLGSPLFKNMGKLIGGCDEINAYHPYAIHRKT